MESDRPVNMRSLKTTVLGYFAALTVLLTLLITPVIGVIILRAVLGM